MSGAHWGWGWAGIQPLLLLDRSPGVSFAAVMLALVSAVTSQRG